MMHYTHRTRFRALKYYRLRGKSTSRVVIASMMLMILRLLTLWALVVLIMISGKEKEEETLSTTFLERVTGAIVHVKP
jgi:hypothetical protein